MKVKVGAERFFPPGAPLRRGGVFPPGAPAEGSGYAARLRRDYVVGLRPSKEQGSGVKNRHPVFGGVRIYYLKVVISPEDDSHTVLNRLEQ